MECSYHCNKTAHATQEPCACFLAPVGRRLPYRPTSDINARTVVQDRPMQKRNHPMRQHARQHLEEQLHRLAQQRRKTTQKLRALTRQTRQAQRYRHGEYVELAGLALLDPGTLLGGLCELATLLTDPERLVRWKMRGDIRLEAHRRHKARRRCGASSMDKGLSETETEGTQV
jgi:Conjugal transfer protein TraD